MDSAWVGPTCQPDITSPFHRKRQARRKNAPHSMFLREEGPNHNFLKLPGRFCNNDIASSSPLLLLPRRASRRRRRHAATPLCSSLLKSVHMGNFAVSPSTSSTKIAYRDALDAPDSLLPCALAAAVFARRWRSSGDHLVAAPPLPGTSRRRASNASSGESPRGRNRRIRVGSVLGREQSSIAYVT